MEDSNSFVNKNPNEKAAVVVKGQEIVQTLSNKQKQDQKLRKRKRSETEKLNSVKILKIAHPTEITKAHRAQRVWRLNLLDWFCWTLVELEGLGLDGGAHCYNNMELRFVWRRQSFE